MGVLDFLGKLNPQKTFDTIAGGIDKLNFSNQERAALNMQLADKVSEYAEKTLGENTVRSKARRTISYIVLGVYMAIVIYSIFVDDVYVKELVKDSAIQTGFIMVLAFFFGGYYIKQINFKGKDKG